MTAYEWIDQDQVLGRIVENDGHQIIVEFGAERWDEFTAADPAPPSLAPIAEAPALSPITSRQMRLTLVRNGVHPDDVSAAIAAMPEGTARDEAMIEWEYAAHFERGHPSIALIGAHFGWDAERIDALWLEALDA